MFSARNYWFDAIASVLHCRDAIQGSPVSAHGRSITPAPALDGQMTEIDVTAVSRIGTRARHALLADADDMGFDVLGLAPQTHRGGAHRIDHHAVRHRGLDRAASHQIQMRFLHRQRTQLGVAGTGAVDMETFHLPAAATLLDPARLKCRSV